MPDIRSGEGEISTSKILVVKDREGRVRPACERRPNGDSLAGYLHIDSRFGEMRAEIVAPDDEDAVILAGDVAESERFIRSRKRTTQGDIQKHLGRRTDYAAAVVAELTRLGIAARKSERGPIEIIN